MRELPIIFSPDMVRALIDGRKTVTRRMIGSNYNVGDLLWVRENWQPDGFPKEDWFSSDCDNYNILFPATQTGHNVMLSNYFFKEHYCKMLYKELAKKGSKYNASVDEEGTSCPVFNVRPSIHLFKEFSRIWLKVVSTRCERLHQISNRDAIAEGIEPIPFKISSACYKDYSGKTTGFRNAVDSFKSLFSKIHGQMFWDLNPLITVIEFKVVSVDGYDSITENYLEELA